MKNKQVVLMCDGDNREMFKKISVSNLPYDAQVVVPETYSAILIKDGQMMDTLGSGRYNIFDTAGFKKVGSVIVEIIFLSKTARLSVRWGTRNQFDMRDEETDLPFRVGANGEFEVQISNPRKAYLCLIGADKEFSTEKLRERLLVRMLSKIEPILAKTIREKKITFDKIAEHKDGIAESILPTLNAMFENDYGLKMFSFTIGELFIDEDDVSALECERKAIKERKRLKEEEELRQSREKEEKEEQRRRDEEERLRRKADERELDDRDWERKKYLRELELRDREMYLEACKTIGWESSAGADKVVDAAKFCRNCGRRCTDNDRFCPDCGSPLALTEKICPKCGRKNAPTARFCGDCGEQI